MHELSQEKALDKKQIGKYIYEKRIQNKLTQQDLANKLYVSDRAVSKWERGLNIPDIETLRDLSRLFNVSTDDILSGTDKKKNEKKSISSLSQYFYQPYHYLYITYLLY